MRTHDALHNREPEAVSVRVLSSGAVEALEGLEKARQGIGRDHRASVRDGQNGVVVVSFSGDLDVPPERVVMDGVLNEVGDEPFEQARVAFNGRRSQGRARPKCEAESGTGWGQWCERE